MDNQPTPVTPTPTPVPTLSTPPTITQPSSSPAPAASSPSPQGPKKKIAGLIFIVLILIAAAAFGGYTFEHQRAVKLENSQQSQIDSLKKQAKASQKSTDTTKTNSATTNPYAGWQTYTSTLGGFSIKYPGSGWTLTAGQLTGSSVTANESQFAINENLGQGSSTSNLKYSAEINIESSPTAISQDNGALTYGLGSAQETLSNGIQLWQTSEDTFNTASVPRCGGNGIVMLKAASNNKLYTSLPNGMYLNFTAGFCNGPDQKLTQSYQQQLNGPELAIAKKILESVTYN